MATNYSFIRPRQKSILRRITKIWLFYLALMVVVVLIAEGFLEIQMLIKENQRKEMESQTKVINLNIMAAKDYYSRIGFEKKVVEMMFENSKDSESAQKSSNYKYRNGFARLMKIIPPQITLKRLKIDRTELHISGSTPSREVYIFLLQAPLKASFNESRVDFYPLTNGWFNFDSVSKKARDEHALEVFE